MQKPTNHDQIFLRNPVMVALDVDSDMSAMNIANLLKDHVGAYKIGPRLIHRYGPELVKKIAMHAPVFVDCKFFDIPSTMEAAVRASFESGATFTTVHALSGEEALKRLAHLEAELNKIRPFKILCVTILTSWDQKSLPANFKNISILEHVTELAKLIIKCGLSGLVCSPEELSALRDHGLISELYVVTPGIRMISKQNLDLTSIKDDQKRTLSPLEAMKSGASALVIGRPIIEALDPLSAVTEILNSLKVK